MKKQKIAILMSLCLSVGGISPVLADELPLEQEFAAEAELAAVQETELVLEEEAPIEEGSWEESFFAEEVIGEETNPETEILTEEKTEDLSENTLPELDGQIPDLEETFEGEEGQTALSEVEDFQEFEEDGLESRAEADHCEFMKEYSEDGSLRQVVYNWYTKAGDEEILVEYYSWTAEDAVWHHYLVTEEGEKEAPFEKTGPYTVGTDEAGNPVQYYIRTTGKPGAGFWKNPETGKMEYFLKLGELPEGAELPAEFYQGRKDDISRHQGIRTVKSKKYYVAADGTLLKGWQTVSGKTYYFLSDGSAATGLRSIEGKYYYFGTDGVMKKGWQTVDGKKYYFASNGGAVTGLRSSAGKYYYFDSKGVMQKGWKTISGKKYYFASNGSAVTGLRLSGGKYYYFNAKGVMQKGWQTISGKKYYFTSNGSAYIGLGKNAGKYYYFNSKGVMQKGWQTVGGKKYYFMTDGSAAIGLKTQAGKKYYFNSAGVLQKGLFKAGSVYYYANSSGALVSGWINYNKAVYYANTKNYKLYRSALVNIEGKNYYFQSDGQLMVNKKNVVINGKNYNIDSKGVAVPVNEAQIYAQNVLNQIGWNLSAAFTYASTSIPYYSNSDVVPAGYERADWYALYGFKNRRGDCYVMACVFYQFAIAMGYDAHFVMGYVPSASGGMVTHGWVEIDMNGGTYVFDPDFTYETKRNGYMITYGTSGTWRYTSYARVN